MRHNKKMTDVNPNEPTLEAAIECLQLPPSDDVEQTELRLDALLFIVQSFSADCFPVLEARLADDNEHPSVRSAVALSLGKVSGEEAFTILEKFADDPDPVVKSYVIQALGMTRLDAAIPLVIAALTDSDNRVFGSASEAIGYFGRKALPQLHSLLQEGKDDARCIAAWNLGELAERASAPVLLQSLKADASEEVQALAIWALGQIGEYSEELLQVLCEASKNANPEIRLRAEVALKRIARHIN